MKIANLVLQLVVLGAALVASSSDPYCDDGYSSSTRGKKHSKFSSSFSGGGKKDAKYATEGCSVEEWCQRVVHDNDDNNNDDHVTFDYIVVGAGAGGGVVASRLAKAGFKTLLLDAGPDYDTPVTQVPFLWPISTLTPEIEWAFRTRNSDSPGRDQVLYPRASMLGGCTMHNAMIGYYSFPGTWSELQELTGDDNFDEAHMRSLWQRIERIEYDTPFPGHGTNGYISTALLDERLFTEPAFFDPQLAALVQKFNTEFPCSPPNSPYCVSIPGFAAPLTLDINGVGAEEIEGFHFSPSTISPSAGYTRSSVYNLIKDVQATTDNLIVKPNSFVTKILTKKGGEQGWTSTKKGKRGQNPIAYGVEVQEGTALYEVATGSKQVWDLKKYFARREVIVSGGAFNTPQILMMSGIGPKDELEDFGIDVVADVPGVGKNLKDKIETPVIMKVSEGWKSFQLNCTLFLEQPDPCYLDFLSGNPSLYTNNGGRFGYQVKTPGAKFPDLFGQNTPYNFEGYRDGWFLDALLSPDSPEFLSFNINNAPEETAGEVTLKSPSPFDAVNIDFMGYADEDVEDTLFLLKQLLDIANDLKTQGIVTEMIRPDPATYDYSSDADLKQYIVDSGWGHHACCSAKMGSEHDRMAVLDGQLRVRGVDHLRVVDNSAFPQHPSFFPVMSIYMLAEKAADDIIREEAVISEKRMGC